MAYQVLIDTLRDAEFSGDYDDVTAFVQSINWQAGMADGYDEVSQPARLNMTLVNTDGRFNQDSAETELATNGSFGSWSGGAPVGWTVNGTTISEVALGNGHGEGGAGACNFYGTPSISQQITYTGRVRVSFTVEPRREGTLIVTITRADATEIVKRFPTAGIKTFDAYTDGTFTLKIESAALGSGTPDITIDSVSVKSVGLYAGALTRGTLVKVKHGSTQLYEGKIVSLTPALGERGARTVTITAECPMLQLLDAEYKPPLLENTTLDVAFDDIFDRAVIAYPYAHLFWVLDVEGCAELGYSTRLYEHASTDFDTGNTTLDWVGDNQDRGQGVSVQGMVRDLMAAELGGRFFFDPCCGRFVFHNRHRDLLNTTVAATYTMDEFDSVSASYGEELVNSAVVTFEPREVGAAGTVLWSEEALPIRLEKLGKKEFQVRFRDADNEQAVVGGKDIMPMVPGVDYSANLAEDGSGRDLTGRLTVVVNASAGGAVISISNTYRKRAYIQTLQLRGTPLIRYPRKSVSYQDGDSIRRNEKLERAYNIPAISDEAFATAAAQWLVARNKEAQTRIGQVMLTRDVDSVAGPLARAIGDRIRITDDWSSYDRDHFIVGVRHEISGGLKNQHRITWILKPAFREDYWLLGTAGRSEISINTLIAL